MKIVFVHSGSENLGVMSLAAYLKSKGHSCYLVFEPDSFGSGSGREIPVLGRLFRMSPARPARKALEYLNKIVYAFSNKILP